MIESIYYKEWYKSRWTLLLILLAFTGVILYSFISISQNLRVQGINNVWDLIVQKGIYYFATIKYLPLLAGIILAISQYTPEMINKRLKLTLHLPMHESKIMMSMLSYGIINLILIFTLVYAVIYWGTWMYFPNEVASWNTVIILPWLMGGLVAYLLTTWICIEPVWKQRIMNSIITILILALFYFDVIPGAYTSSIVYLIVLAILCVLFSFFSLIRFKDGELF